MHNYLEFINQKNGEILIRDIKEIQKMINGFKVSLNRS